MLSRSKFTDTEVAQHIDRLFATNVEFRKRWYETKPNAGPMLGMKVSDIDSTITDGLKAAFAKRGITDPTDAQILDAYWKGVSTGKIGIKK